MRPNDPFYSLQWHFRLIGNIEAIWDDYNGAGVHVGVYDTGVDSHNVDLRRNYDSSLNVTYDGHTYSGDPNSFSTANQNHGTAVAGLIGASGNNKTGVVGVAWGSSLTGVNIYNSDTPFFVDNPDRTAFLSILHQMTKFDVVNNSWNNVPDYATSQYYDDELKEYGHAERTGRGGLGTVIVQAAGNDDWDTGGTPRNASRYTVTVSATDRGGYVTDYSNFGNSVLVAAPGGNNSIVTTDRHGDAGYEGINDGNFDNSGDYTNTFGGTSAATPIVSGVVALMLQANPNLGWRDVQEILSMSATLTGSALGASTPVGNEFGNWRINTASDWNGGGRHTHLSYGYGMLNAYNAVRMAEAYKYFSTTPSTSDNEATATSVTLPSNGAITDNGTTQYSFNVGSDIVIEHVDIALTLSHGRANDLTFSLVSPDGHTSFLGDFQKKGAAGISNFTYDFGLDNLRGQSSAGTWTLIIKDRHAGETGTLQAVDFSAYGHYQSANDVYHYTDEFSDMVPFGGRTNLNDTDGGTDWIDASAVTSDSSFYLNQNKATIDGIDISVAGIENIVGGSGNDSIFGDGGINTLVGGYGQDYIDGGGGVDRMIGGRDGDYYVVDNPGDIVIEKPREGTFDTIIATINFTLSDDQSIEIIEAGGDDTAPLVLTGNAFSQEIMGNRGNNILDGGGGADTLDGYNGDDTYYIDNPQDKIDLEVAGWGTDTVICSTSYTLAAGVEIEYLDAVNRRTRTEIDLTGNEFGQTISGGFVDNVLRGGQGNDTLIGGRGTDTLIGGKGPDTFDFTTTAEAGNTESTCDTIGGFAQADGDRIDLSQIDANTQADGNQEFAFIGSQIFDARAGEVRAVKDGGSTYVYGDVDGDGQADFVIHLNSVVKLNAADFVL